MPMNRDYARTPGTRKRRLKGGEGFKIDRLFKDIRIMPGMVGTCRGYMVEKSSCPLLSSIQPISLASSSLTSSTEALSGTGGAM